VGIHFDIHAEISRTGSNRHDYVLSSGIARPFAKAIDTGVYAFSAIA
jgi:hypothetical protein